MDKKRLLFYMELALILILLIFCLRIAYLGNHLQETCKNTYDVNATCPCVATGKTNSAELNISSLNFSSLHE